MDPTAFGMTASSSTRADSATLSHLQTVNRVTVVLPETTDKTTTGAPRPSLPVKRTPPVGGLARVDSNLMAVRTARRAAVEMRYTVEPIVAVAVDTCEESVSAACVPSAAPMEALVLNATVTPFSNGRPLVVLFALVALLAFVALLSLPLLFPLTFLLPLVVLFAFPLLFTLVALLGLVSLFTFMALFSLVASFAFDETFLGSSFLGLAVLFVLLVGFLLLGVLLGFLLGNTLGFGLLCLLLSDFLLGRLGGVLLELFALLALFLCLILLDLLGVLLVFFLEKLNTLLVLSLFLFFALFLELLVGSVGSLHISKLALSNGLDTLRRLDLVLLERLGETLILGRHDLFVQGFILLALDFQFGFKLSGL